MDPFAPRFEPHRQFIPEEGGWLTVMLPGETMRCQVERVIDVDSVIVEISGMPMSKSHFFRKGDKSGVRRRVENGRDVWEAMDDRDFLAGRSPNVPPPAEEPKRQRKKGA